MCVHACVCARAPVEAQEGAESPKAQTVVGCELLSN